MTTLSASPASPRLSFGAAISAAHRNVFRRFGRFVKMAAIPFCLALVFTIVKIPANQVLPGSDLVFAVLDLLPFAFLAVALNRAMLLGEQPGILPPEPLGRRTWLYIGYSLLMVVIAVIPLFVLAIVALGINFAMGGGSHVSLGWQWVVPFGIAITGGLLYLSARLGLAFPALSVDEKLGFRGSWRLSKGSGLKLVGLLLAVIAFCLLAATVGSLLLGQDISIHIGTAPELPPGTTLTDNLLDNAPGMIWSTLVSFGGFGLMTAAFADAYAQLSGWGAVREEILERFE